MQRYIVIGGMKLPIDTADDQVVAREVMVKGGIEAAVVWEKIVVEDPGGATTESWVPLEDKFPVVEP